MSLIFYRVAGLVWTEMKPSSARSLSITAWRSRFPDSCCKKKKGNCPVRVTPVVALSRWGNFPVNMHNDKRINFTRGTLPWQVTLQSETMVALKRSQKTAKLKICLIVKKMMTGNPSNDIQHRNILQHIQQFNMKTCILAKLQNALKQKQSRDTREHQEKLPLKGLRRHIALGLQPIKTSSVSS